MGLLVIISSPAGGGKDTVIARLITKFPNSIKIVTTTSRPPRPNDVDGVSYNFLSEAEFKEKINHGYFLEYNYCVGNYYGTPKEYFYDLLDKYDIVFSNIDVNGKHSLDALGIKNISIFLMPEDNNLEDFRARAESRGGMTAQMVADRMKLGLEEIEKAQDYDYKIVNYNGKLDETVAQIAEILQERLAIDKKG